MREIIEEYGDVISGLIGAAFLCGMFFSFCTDGAFGSALRAFICW